MDVSRLSLLTSSLKKNENETAMRQSLSNDRHIVEEVLTMELVDREWSSARTGGIDFLSVLLLLEWSPLFKVQHKILISFIDGFHPLRVYLRGRRLL